MQATKQAPTKANVNVQVPFLATPQGELTGGAKYKGFMYAQRVAAAIMNHGTEYSALAREVFDMPQDVRTESVAALRDWQKQCKENAKSAAPIKGFSPKDWERMANSATTRASQLSMIGKAVTAGLGKAEIQRQTGGAKFENCGFDLIRSVAAKWLETHAADGTKKKGRPTIDAFIKLFNYAKKLEGVSEQDKAHLAAAEDKLVELAAKFKIELPVDEEKEEKSSRQKAKDTTPRRIRKVNATPKPEQPAPANQ